MELYDKKYFEEYCQNIKYESNKKDNVSIKYGSLFDTVEWNERYFIEFNNGDVLLFDEYIEMDNCTSFYNFLIQKNIVNETI